jgi:anti-sigma-K factor RskA
VTEDSAAVGSSGNKPGLGRFSHNISFCRHISGALATLSLALVVAAMVARDPPEFSSMPVIAVLRDVEQRPIWAIRLARSAHQIAADSIHIAPASPEHGYRLWLLTPNAPGLRRLGLLPQSGRKRIAVSPQTARLLTGAGELLVTLEPSAGSPGPGPGGPVVLRGTLENSS